MTPLLLFAILTICVVAMRSEGLWTNAINWVNVVFAALLATNYFESVADWLKGLDSSFDYFWDFISLWALFAIFFSGLRFATDWVSRTKVSFSRNIDLVGGVFFAGWIGWVLVCFTTMSLHTAPLGQAPLGGSFQPTPQASNFPLNPDRLWLSFVQMESDGALSRPAPQSNPKLHEFDPRGDFILRYGASRRNFERAPDIRVPGGRSVEIK
jgi:hypothetical protein